MTPDPLIGEMVWTGGANEFGDGAAGGAGLLTGRS